MCPRRAARPGAQADGVGPAAGLHRRRLSLAVLHAAASDGALWSNVIIWLSIAGCVMCLSGLVWGVWRYAPLDRYRLKRVESPHRTRA